MLVRGIFYLANNKTLITTQEAFEEQIKLLQNDLVIAFDTEFIRERTYFPKLSLLQIAGAKTAFAIDILADINIGKLLEILKSSKVVKVCHSARQDLEALTHHFNIKINNLFDSQIALMLLGFNEPPSYEKLVAKYLNVKIFKGEQYSNWLKRPLTESQIEYAISDVTYLYECYPLILRDLKIARKLKWMSEECRALVKSKNFSTTPKDLLKRLASKLDSLEKLTLAYKLLVQRESLAKELDMNRSSLAQDDEIITSSNHFVIYSSLMEKLLIEDESNFIKKPLSSKDISIIKQVYDEKIPHFSDEQKTKLKSFKEKLLEIASRYNLSPQLIANSEELKQLIKNPNSPPETLTSGWRKKVFFDN